MESSSSADVPIATVGELCRRATSLASRAIVPLGLAYLVIASVGAMTTLAETSHGDQQGLVVVLGQLAKPGGVARVAHFLARQRAPQRPGWTSLPTFLVDPLVSAAMIAVASVTSRRGERPLSAGFAIAAKRYRSMITLAVLWLVAVLAAVLVPLVLAIMLIVVAGIGFALGRVHIGRAAVPAMTAFVVALPLATILAASVLGIAAYEVSRFACVVEGAGPWRSFTGSFARVLAAVGLRRTMLVGVTLTAVLATNFVLGFVEWSVGLALLHSVPAAIGLGVVSGAASAIWVVAFSAVFYDDLRAREEARGRLAESRR